MRLLKKAIVGIAREGATDEAQGTAEVVLSSPEPSVVMDDLDLPRQVLQRTKSVICSIARVLRADCSFWSSSCGELLQRKEKSHSKALEIGTSVKNDRG